MKCKVCDADIAFCYKTPTKSYIIENDHIIRDDAWQGVEYDNPYLKFYCSNDSEHDIDSEDIVLWSSEIETKFYDENILEL